MTEQEVTGLCTCTLSTRLPHCLCRCPSQEGQGRSKEAGRLQSSADVSGETLRTSSRSQTSL